MEDQVQKFVAELLKNAGIDNMPADFKKQYADKLGVEVQRRLGIMALDELDEKGITDFEAFTVKNKSPQSKDLLEFFNGHITDFKGKVEATLSQFAQEFISSAQKLKGTKLSD
jgi:hypothetical protein